MKKITTLITKFKYFTNYLYYYKTSIIKNVHPCKLIGEKINPRDSETIILYKIYGKPINKEISLQNLLDNKKLVEKFHPSDAVKLGSIAFKDVILELEKGAQKEKFYQIKNIMLNSTHDIYPGNKLDTSMHWYKSNAIKDYGKENDCLDFAILNNIYPCKLVSAEFNYDKNCTVIVFTILGKREGYKKNAI